MHWDKRNKGYYHSVPDPNLEVRGGGGGGGGGEEGVSQKILYALWASVYSKNKGALPGSTTVILNDASSWFPLCLCVCCSPVWLFF